MSTTLRNHSLAYEPASFFLIHSLPNCLSATIHGFIKLAGSVLSDFAQQDSTTRSTIGLFFRILQLFYVSIASINQSHTYCQFMYNIVLIQFFNFLLISSVEENYWRFVRFSLPVHRSILVCWWSESKWIGNNRMKQVHIGNGMIE